MADDAQSERRPRREWPTLQGVSFRPARADELPACIEMLDDAFPRWPNHDLRLTQRDYLEWELEMPGGDSVAVVSELDGGLAAFNVRLTRHFDVGRRAALVSEGADRAVAPRFQGRGVYRQSQRWSLDYVSGYDFSINYSRNPVILGNRTRRAAERNDLFLDFGNPLQVLAKPLDALRLARKEAPGNLFRQAAIATALTAANASVRLRHPRHPDLRHLRVRPMEDFDGLADVVAEASSQFDFIQRRDAGYLNWRYADPRGGRSAPTVVEVDGLPLGFAVTTVSRGRGYLLDLMVRPGRTDAAHVLLAEAVTRLRGQGVDAVVTWSNANHPLYPLLRRMGFIDTRRVTGISIRRRDADDNMTEVVESPASRVHLMPGDSTAI